MIHTKSADDPLFTPVAPYHKRELTEAAWDHRAMTTGICDSMMMCRVPPPKIIWRMRLWV
jgi:hypothetical protein